MLTLDLELGERSYPIYIGRGLLEQPELLRRHIKSRQVLVVTNDTVAPHYLDRVVSGLADYQVASVVLPDGEQFKTLEVLGQVFDRLLELRHNRDTTLIALGGGVVGDMAGFAAAAYQRGVDFIQIPSTLLSQVDSSVGGKTGVNHPLGKNMIGAFHQPRAVLIDTDTLDTLPDREYASGMAEVIKYGLIRDRGFFEWLEANMDGLMLRDKQLLAEAIARSCRSKAEIVAIDERESGVRALLNLGHTFGHAIETAQGYGAWLHGEAVAVGTVLAADLSRRLGWLAEADVKRIEALFVRARLPVTPPIGMETDEFLALMAVDKKVLDGRLRLVLLRSIGDAVVTADFPLALLETTLKERLSV